MADEIEAEVLYLEEDDRQIMIVVDVMIHMIDLPVEEDAIVQIMTDRVAEVHLVMVAEDEAASVAVDAAEAVVAAVTVTVKIDMIMTPHVVQNLNSNFHVTRLDEKELIYKKKNSFLVDEHIDPVMIYHQRMIQDQLDHFSLEILIDH